MVGETVANIAQLATLNVLLDGIEGLFLRNLHLRICPAWNFDNHIEDAVIAVSEERDVVERRDDIAVLLKIGTVL